MRGLLASGVAALALIATAATAQPSGQALEQRFDGMISTADQLGWLQTMSSAPNHVGAPHNKANADMQLALFKQWGWDARIERFDVLYPTPISTTLELVTPTRVQLGGQEPAIAEDPTSSQTAGALPPYLAEENFPVVRERADRVRVHQRSFTEQLLREPAGRFDSYVLLDAQDWMTDDILTGLWREITRTARPGARVIFRTAGAETILPGRIDTEILDRWTYRAEESRALFKRDRSAAYGGFHLYVLKD